MEKKSESHHGRISHAAENFSSSSSLINTKKIKNPIERENELLTKTGGA